MADNPKVFISYSWSSPAHEGWVLRLAEELAEQGVHPILDKWDLREGEDANRFMERIVNDADITKVIMVCDRAYRDKANARRGGAGTEAQILSAELYRSEQNTKFCAVLPEKDEHGQPFLPTYYTTRIYIDLSDDDQRVERMEQLLRWIFDKPLYVRPAVGPKPSFVSEAAPNITLHTSSRARRAVDALRNQKPFWRVALKEYFDTLTAGLGSFRVVFGTDFEAKIMKSIDDFLPFRNEALEVFKALALVDPGAEAHALTHRFIEGVLIYLHRQEGRTQWRECEFENFWFIVYEMYVYLIAVLLKNEKFEFASFLIQQEFYAPELAPNSNRAMVPFSILQYGRFATFEEINQKSPERKYSYRAYIMKERLADDVISWRDLAQADLTLALAARSKEGVRRNWRPDTLLYFVQSEVFPIYARSQSRSYFQRLSAVLGLAENDFRSLVTKIDAADRFFGARFDMDIPIAHFTALDKICSSP